MLYGPYTTPAITLSIGNEAYTVPRHYLNQSPKLASELSDFSDIQTISLHGFDADIGHTLVHYLHEREYQTLKQQGLPDPTGMRTEYRRSALVYYAARSLEVDGLATLAKREIESFDKGLSIFDILDVAKEVYLQLHEEETWFHDYLTAKITAAFAVDGSLFTQECFLNHIGGPFAKALVKNIVKIYTGKISGAVSNGVPVKNEPCKELILEDVPGEPPFENDAADVLPEPAADAPPEAAPDEPLYEASEPEPTSADGEDVTTEWSPYGVPEPETAPAEQLPDVAEWPSYEALEPESALAEECPDEVVEEIPPVSEPGPAPVEESPSWGSWGSWGVSGVIKSKKKKKRHVSAYEAPETESAPAEDPPDDYIAAAATNDEPPDEVFWA